MKESNIQSKILSYLNSTPFCMAENVVGNASQSGRSDINACYKGVCLKLEVKGGTEGYGATEQQKLYLRRWEIAGARVAVVESIKDVKRILELIDEGRANEIQAWNDRKRKS